MAIKIVVNKAGSPGIKGDQGKSAYQYAVESGYTGTEQQFADDQANFASNASQVHDDMVAAGEFADSAGDSASSASLLANTATNAANTATEQANLSISAKEDSESARDSAIDAKDEAEQIAATIQPGGIVQRDDIRLVSGDEVAKKTVQQKQLFDNINLYDYRNDVSGDYTINITTGALLAQANCSVSEIIDVTGIDKVVISNRTGAGGVRFLSSTGTPMKPLLANGSEASNYSGSWIGEFYKPVGATGFQFVTKFNGTTNKTNITARKDEYPNEYIYDSLIKKTGGLYLQKTNQSYSLSGKMGNSLSEITFQTRIGANQSSNPNFTLIDMRLNGTIFKNSTDDICPILVGTGHIGGNHGWGVANTITKTAHGKTLADVGSIYTDTVLREFVILRIVDTNTLIMCGRNIGTGGNLVFPTPTGTLTYKENGTNTAPISSYTQARLPNLYNTVQLNKSVVLVDGKEIVNNGKVPCDNVKIVEDYDIFDLDSTLVRLSSLRPTGGYTVQPNLNSLGADKMFNFSIIYNFWSPGKCTITHSIFTYKQVNFGYFGGIQCFAISDALGKLYIPKILPVGGTQDFRMAPVFNAPESDILYRESDGWEFPDNPPSRLISYLPGGAGVHVGYITDFASGSDRSNNLDHAIRVATTKKIYPMAISMPIDIIPEYTNYTFSMFYNTIDYSQNMGVATSKDIALCNDSLYVFLDYHQSGVDALELPILWGNKDVSVIEKSSNVELLNSGTTGYIKVVSSVGSGSYGFIVLKLT